MVMFFSRQHREVVCSDDEQQEQRQKCGDKVQLSIQSLVCREEEESCFCAYSLSSHDHYYAYYYYIGAVFRLLMWLFRLENLLHFPISGGTKTNLFSSDW